MNNRTQWMEDIQKNISDLIARSPAADVERNVRAMMTQAFSKLDLCLLYTSRCVRDRS